MRRAVKRGARAAGASAGSPGVAHRRCLASRRPSTAGVPHGAIPGRVFLCNCANWRTFDGRCAARGDSSCEAGYERCPCGAHHDAYRGAHRRSYPSRLLRPELRMPQFPSSSSVLATSATARCGSRARTARSRPRAMRSRASSLLPGRAGGCSRGCGGWLSRRKISNALEISFDSST